MAAYTYWEHVWRSGAGQAWVRPDSWVVDELALVRSQGIRSTLDLGCGLGRHAVLLAQQGYRSHASDRAGAAVAATREAARRHGVDVSIVQADMAALPYGQESFDFILAFNVCYHTDRRGLRRTISEVRRVLRPGGLYAVTMLSKRNVEYGRGIETSPDTFCQPDALDDKVHPHLYADRADLVEFHDGFKLVRAKEMEQSTAGSFHWQCLFQVGST